MTRKILNSKFQTPNNTKYLNSDCLVIGACILEFTPERSW